MVPLHTWLPDAAEQSTPGTATLLVGVLDKIGTFGMIKFCLGLFPEASVWVAPFMTWSSRSSRSCGGPWRPSAART
jgi:NADH-quinone oxidoreductase subunit M